MKLLSLKIRFKSHVPVLSNMTLSTAATIKWYYLRLLLLILSAPVSSAIDIPFSEFLALSDLYLSTGGVNWNWLSLSYGNEWDLNQASDDGLTYPNPCVKAWQGLRCSPQCFGTNQTSGCTILSISLSSYNLIGNLPTSLGDLPNLQNLDLSNNQISGNLPDSLYTLPNLQTVNLNNNQISGNIDKFQLMNLTSLQTINLSHNQLTGTLPILNSGNTLDNILIHNNVTSFYTNLYLIDFSYNGFTGYVYNGISLFQALRSLNLRNNQLKGNIPMEIGLCQSLEYLDLSMNHFTGGLPYTLTTLSQLQVFHIRHNNLNSILDDRGWSQLPLLKSIDISENNFMGNFPSLLFHSVTLQHISLAQNCFVTSVTNDICQANNLQYLNLDGIYSGKSCRISILKSYITVNINNEIPDCIFQMSNLKHLFMAGNGLHGQLPLDYISPSLETVNLAYNRISGPLPMIFKNYPFIRFDISFNKISGTCHDCIMNLASKNSTTATSLSLEVNRLSGELSPYFYSAKTLSVVSGNIFDCEVQTELPKNDPGRGQYICATHDTDISFYISTGIIVAIIAIICTYVMKDIRHVNELDINNEDMCNETTPTRDTQDDDGLDPKIMMMYEEKSTKNIKKSPINRLPSLSLANIYDEINLKVLNLHRTIEKLIGSRGFSKTSIFVHQRTSLFTPRFSSSSSPGGPRDRNTSDSFMDQKRPEILQHYLDSYIFNKRNHFIQLLRSHILTKSLFQWIKITTHVMYTKPDDLIETTRFLRILVEIRNTFWVITLYIITISIPTYLGIRYSNHKAFNTHTYTYAFIPSMAYFTGFVPAALCFVVIVGCSYLALMKMTKIQKKDSNFRNRRSYFKRKNTLELYQMNSDFENSDTPWIDLSMTNIHHTNSASITSRLSFNDNNINRPSPQASLPPKLIAAKKNAKFMLYFVVPLINLTFVMTVNILFVYSILTLPSGQQLLISSILSVVKMVWNMLIIPVLMQTVKGFGPMFIRKCIMQTLILIFNITLAPIFVNAVASTDCLTTLFFPPKVITATVMYNTCSQYDSTGTCVLQTAQTSETNLEPGFVYGFTCSSSTLKNFIPEYVQLYAFVMVIMPSVAIIMFSLMSLKTEPINVTHENEQRTPIHSFLIRFARFLQNLKTIPPIYKNAQLLGHYGPGTPDSDQNKNCIHLNPHDRKAVFDSYYYTTKRTAFSPKQLILNPDTIISHLLGHLMVLITFGIAYPPLAILISVTVSIVTFQWQTLVGRYLSQIATKDTVEFQQLKLQIEVGCHGISRRFFRKVKWIIICIMAGFFVLFGFDMVADNNYQPGNKGWLWATICYGFYPFFMWILYNLIYRRKYIKKRLWQFYQYITDKTVYEESSPRRRTTTAVPPNRLSHANSAASLEQSVDDPNLIDQRRNSETRRPHRIESALTLVRGRDDSRVSISSRQSLNDQHSRAGLCLDDEWSECDTSVQEDIIMRERSLSHSSGGSSEDDDD